MSERVRRRGRGGSLVSHLLEIGDRLFDVNLTGRLEGQREDLGRLSHVQLLGLQHWVFNTPPLHR